MSRRNQVARERRHQKNRNTTSGRSASAESPKVSQPQVSAAVCDHVSADLASSAENKMDEIEAAVLLLSSESAATLPVTMIDADSSVQECSDNSQSSCCLTEATSVTIATDSQSRTVSETREPSRSPDDITNPLQFMLQAFRDGLTELQSSLRDEFRTAIRDLQSAQAAAAASQSEVLRTLTEVMCQTAAVNRDMSTAGVEATLNGLEDRIVQRLSHLKPSLAVSSASATAEEAATPAKAVPHISTVKLKEASGVVSKSWEQIRSELMARADLGHDQHTDIPQRSEQLPEFAPLTSDRHFRFPEQDPTLEIPPAADVDNMSIESLRDAFHQREAFLTTLIARIRRQQESSEPMLSREQLCEIATKLPDELELQVRQTLRQMEDLARMGELELSLERARIARQVNQLEHTQQLLERNARQLGMALNPDGSIAAHKNPTCRNSSSRRWLGKLGFGQ